MVFYRNPHDAERLEDRIMNTTKTLALSGLLAFGLAACGDNDDDTIQEPEPTPVSGLVGLGDEDAATSIQTLGGCFLVGYQFVEDGQNDYSFEDNIEYMDVAADGDGFKVRNFLVVPTGPGQFMSFLHWVQDWTPLGDGGWHLRVTDGQDNLRYEADGVWRFNQFESEAAMAAKPNRDSERTDYAMLERRNALQLVGGNWYHSQVNIKMTDAGEPVSSELGWIIYSKQVDETPCDPAKEIANPE